MNKCVSNKQPDLFANDSVFFEIKNIFVFGIYMVSNKVDNNFIQTMIIYFPKFNIF